MIRAEAERKAKEENLKLDDAVYGAEDSMSYSQEPLQFEDEEYYQNQTAQDHLEQEAGDQGHLGVPTKPYDRVISDSTNELPEDGAGSGGKKKKKKKKKKNKKKKRR